MIFFQRAALVLVTTTILGQGVSSCSFIKELVGWEARPPRLRMVGLKITKLGYRTVEANLEFEVDNPNEFALELSELVYDFELDSQPMAKGTHREKLKVASESKALITLPIEIFADVVVKMAKYVLTNNKKAELRWSASADFHTPVGVIAVSESDGKPLVQVVESVAQGL